MADPLGREVNSMWSLSPHQARNLYSSPLCLKGYMGLAVTARPISSLAAFCPTEMAPFWLAGECPFLFTE